MTPRNDDGELVLAMTTTQIKRLTPLVLAALFVWRLVRGGRGRSEHPTH